MSQGNSAHIIAQKNKMKVYIYFIACIVYAIASLLNLGIAYLYFFIIEKRITSIGPLIMVFVLLGLSKLSFRTFMLAKGRKMGSALFV